MNRREALLLSGALALAASAPRLAHGQEVEHPDIAKKAHDLYERALVFDANAGPPAQDEFPFPKEMLDVSRNSGVTALKLSVGSTNSNFEDTIREIAWVMRVVEAHPEVFSQIRQVSDIAKAKRERRLGILLSFESTDMFEGKVERIALFRNLGVRVMQLSYNKTSLWGSGVMADPPAGISDLGRKAVAAMNEQGVAVDISHAHPLTAFDVLKVATRSPLITHGGCNAIHKHPRNKDDDLLRAVAEKGGVVGIYDLPYLTASPKQPTLDDYMAHMTHALNVCGEDHVGIGSDSSLSPWDTSPETAEAFRKETERRKATGVAAPEEDRPMYVIGLNTNRRTEVIADALLKHGYSTSVAEKVLGRNFIDTLGRIWA